MSLCLYISLSQSVCMSLCLSLSVSQFVCVAASVSLFLLVSLYICLFLSISAILHFTSSAFWCVIAVSVFTVNFWSQYTDTWVAMDVCTLKVSPSLLRPKELQRRNRNTTTRIQSIESEGVCRIHPIQVVVKAWHVSDKWKPGCHTRQHVIPTTLWAYPSNTYLRFVALWGESAADGWR